MTKPTIKSRYFELTFENGKREYMCVTSEKKTEQLSFDIWNMCCEKGEKVYAVTPCRKECYVQWSLSLLLTERLNLRPN